jgi:glucokinase
MKRPCSAPSTSGQPGREKPGAGQTMGQILGRRQRQDATPSNSIGFLANIIDPAAIIVGGSLGLAGGRYWETMVASAREHIWAASTRELPILPAALGTTAGLIGAALAAERRGG